MDDFKLYRQIAFSCQLIILKPTNNLEYSDYGLGYNTFYPDWYWRKKITTFYLLKIDAHWFLSDTKIESVCNKGYKNRRVFRAHEENENGWEEWPMQKIHPLAFQQQINNLSSENCWRMKAKTVHHLTAPGWLLKLIRKVMDKEDK